MKETSSFNLQVRIMFIFIGVLLFTGCASTAPWTCKCDCEKQEFECNGMTIEHSIDNY